MARRLYALLATTAIILTPACAQERVDATSKAAIEQVVRDYILENPEIIEEALIKLSEKQRLEKAQLAEQKIQDNYDAIYNDPADYSIGPADAPITVVEFFDYRCGYCKRSASWATQLPQQYDNKVRVVFKEFPILSAESEKAALAAAAAGRQDKYIEMHMALMELDNKTGFGPDVIDEAARSVGVDVDLMRADMKSMALQKHVADSKSLGRKLGIDGTPAFLVGTSQVPGADTASVEALIEAELERLS